MNSVLHCTQDHPGLVPTGWLEGTENRGGGGS